MPIFLSFFLSLPPSFFTFVAAFNRRERSNFNTIFRPGKVASAFNQEKGHKRKRGIDDRERA